MVLGPVLYNQYNPNTQQYFKYGECLLRNGTSTGLISYIRPNTLIIHIIRLARGNTHQPHTLRGYSLARGNTHQPRTLCGHTVHIARLFSRPGKHPLTAHPHSYIVWLLLGFGSLPSSLPRLWETPYTTY